MYFGTAGLIVQLAGLGCEAALHIGHRVATRDHTEKKRQAEWFFGGPLDAERRTFLNAASADYVVVGPAERLVGASAYHDPSLTLMYDRDGVTVYQVVGTDAAGHRP